MTFTARIKEALAYPVRSRMEDRRLRIPYDPEIRADLRQVTKQVTPAGTVRFAAERTVDGHADHFWALALALQAATVPAAEYDYQPAAADRRAANPRHDDDPDDDALDVGGFRSGAW